MANRPLMFKDYIGQERMKLQIRITQGACRKNNMPMPHMLFFGPPGLGKTTIANVVANEFGVKFLPAMANNIQNAADLEDLLAELSDSRPDVLFIDEIHRLPVKVEELLYTVMEDFILETDMGGPDGKSRERCWVPKFTLIGATTMAGALSKPLLDRFGLPFLMEHYHEDEIVQILSKLAERESIIIDDEAKDNIAKRSKGVARIAINYFQRCKEYADFYSDVMGHITYQDTQDQFENMMIDEIGLDAADYKVLRYLLSQIRPVGLDALAVAVDIDKNTIANMIEPYLVQKGLVNRERGGRVITERGRLWINGETTQEPPKDDDEDDSDGDIRRVGR